MNGEDLLLSADALGRTHSGPPVTDALRDATFAIRRGECVAVTGPSGSGKSTLLHLLGLLDTPTRGRYILDGQDTSMLDDRRRAHLRRSHVGFVFQAFHLLKRRSALANVELGVTYRKGIDRSAAFEALQVVGMSHRADAAARTLSGGEQQRVAIARAIVGRPRLLLCDEPTGNLDSANSAAIVELLLALHRGGTTIMIVTHDEAIAARADRVLHAVDGVIAERSPVGPT